MIATKTKQIKLKLTGLDGNAFALLGAFKRQAEKEKWPAEEIKAVVTEAMKGNYDHLLATLSEHCINGGR